MFVNTLNFFEIIGRFPVQRNHVIACKYGEERT